MSEQEVFDTLRYRIEVDTSGNRCYRNAASQPHRIGGPAIERANGHKEWWQNGQCHRIDGPAIEFADGTKQWYQGGLLHRTDGPAIEWADGDKFWYINGRMMTEDEFNQAVKLL